MDLTPLKQAVIDGDQQATQALTAQALEAGVDPIRLVHEYLAPAMDEVGRRFETHEYFLPELVLSARAMKAAMELIRPRLVAGGTAKQRARVVIGTVRGDQHDIGKNLVAAMLEGAGFEVFDLGVNVSPEQFVEVTQKNGAQIVAMSALLTTTMPAMKETIELLKRAGLRERVRVLVGGAPVTQRFAEEIGAVGYSENAPGAVQLARRCLGIEEETPS